MKQWSRKRKASFWIHTAFVSVPLAWSTVSALLLWHDLFNSWWLAVPMVAVVEVLALAGFVLNILGVPSPFVRIKGLLPVISVVPLGRELYLLLEHNGQVTAATVTATVVVLLTVIAWQCYRTIEGLFIDPLVAARERMNERWSTTIRPLIIAQEERTIIDRAIADYYGAPAMLARPQEPPPQPTYAEPRLTGASPSKPCKYCGEPVDFSGAGRHGRNHKAFGNCQGVKA
jgi:hypothetical protein